MSSIDSCINKINDNTNYNDLQQQVVTKGPFVYTFNNADTKDEKYLDNPTINFKKWIFR